MTVFDIMKKMNGPDFTGAAHKNINNYKRLTGHAIYNIHPTAVMFDDISTSKQHQWLKLGYMSVFELLQNMKGPDVTGGPPKNKQIIKGGLGMLVIID